MADPVFVPVPAPVSLGEILALTGATASPDIDPFRMFAGVAPLELAGPDDVSFAERARYLTDASATRAGACFCRPKDVASLPPGTIALITAQPQRAYAVLSGKLYPSALRPGPVTAAGIAPTAFVSPGARIEDGVTVEPGAVIGAGAEIGRGTTIGPTAVIGANVRIGRDCSIGPGSSVLHALVGDRVILHPGVRIGQDGFGFVGGPNGHLKIPQLGRVLIQDDVEIGAGTAIDRGAGRDTVIGEGTKIDNLVQIGHNVSIGRRCVIAGQVGVAGSATICDGVVIGGQTGINGHITIGEGAQIAGVSAVHRDVPAGGKWAGAPARPLQEWLRARSHDARSVRRPGHDNEGNGGGEHRAAGGTE
ncbi:MAG: UDP-3-O-(3-hydroxymyristoyl)glucosamine N-acyltransferase [Bauldia sp.]